MNICEPIFERWLIADTYACRLGKGRIAALQWCQAFSQRFAFYLKLDIRKYFESVSHAILIERLHRLFKDRRLLELMDRIIAGFESIPGRGLLIGSLTSQHFANFYLGGFDRFVRKVFAFAAMFATWMVQRPLGEFARRTQGPPGRGPSVPCRSIPTRIEGHSHHQPDGPRAGFPGVPRLPEPPGAEPSEPQSLPSQTESPGTGFSGWWFDPVSLQQRATAMVAFTRTPGLSSWGFRRHGLVPRLAKSDKLLLQATYHGFKRTRRLSHDF